jgi:gamma-glutamylcyclotransferase (GGCT)/AIG2-like uncharacterized protein YtfP
MGGKLVSARRGALIGRPMPLLFSYGTLQLESVQLSTFGRRLAGWRDDLVGYERSTVVIDDPQVAATLGKTHHDNVDFTGNDASRVSGMVFEIADGELASVDAYEAAFSYTRVAATLASGAEAWVYVHSGSLRRGVSASVHL